MEKIFLDFMDEKKVSVIKEKAKEAILADIMEYLAQKYETVRKTASNEFGVIVGCGPDPDGFSQDICVSIKCTTRNWYDKDTGVDPETGKKKRGVTAYRFEEEADAYEMEQTAKDSYKK